MNGAVTLGAVWAKSASERNGTEGVRIGIQSWGSEGDVRPFVALAGGLAGAGHTVTLAITDVTRRDYSAAAARYSFDFREVRHPLEPTACELSAIWQRIICTRNPIAQAERIMAYGFDPAVEAMYAAARELCTENDLVVGHFCMYPLGVAAEKAGVPVATVQLAHNDVPSAHLPPPGFPRLGRGFYGAGWRIVRPIINRIFLPRVNALRTREGLRPHTDAMSETWASERLNLVAVSPLLFERPPDWGPQHQVCGFLNLPPEGASEEVASELEAFLSSGAPPIYFTFGSMIPPSDVQVGAVVSLWTETVRRLGCRAVLQLPAEAAVRGDLPADTLVVRRAPHRRVFPRCAVVVHHGGAGTTQATLMSGRPSVVVAHVADQTFWGMELRRLGTSGRPLQRTTVTPQRLAHAIRQVFDTPRMAERAQEIGLAMANEDGVKTAVALIEERFISHSGTDRRKA